MIRPGPAVSRPVRNAALALIVAGVILRAWAVGHARFTGDESYFWATARNTATFQAAPVFGPSVTSSNAYHPGPLFYYLMAVPQRLGASPWFGGLFVVLLHAIAALLLFSLVRRARGDRAGLIALALVAFAPWDVLYADRIWLSCVAPVWGTFVLYAAARAADAPKWQGALAFFALTCPQLHMSAPIVWIAAGALVVLAPPARFSWKAIAIGCAAAGLAYAIPLWHELNHGFANTRALLLEGGGKEGWEQLRLAPLRVLGYAVLYGTSEIGYHFSTGYWRPFDELAQYASAEGLRGWLDLHGPLWAAAGVVSIAASLLGWGAAIGHAARALARRAVDLEARVTLSLLAGLFAAIALLVVAKKGYFPHYTNLFMPAVLLPIACGLDALVERAGRARAAVYAAVAVSMAAMLSSAVRYYRNVDTLNGLDATMGMVARVVQEPGPFALGFDGFQNGFAWQMVANVAHGKQLSTSSSANVAYQVKNRAPFGGGEPPHGATLHGAVLLERRIR